MRIGEWRIANNGSEVCSRVFSGCRSLAALGPLARKMRIHAKEDIYEATRQRVAEAEDQQKKNWLVVFLIASFKTKLVRLGPLRPLYFDLTSTNVVQPQQT